ncbi:MAG: hypothetical protein KJO30_15700 [Boseongicola sp.]|nr:hypothetical protein [Boseongicola sp.]
MAIYYAPDTPGLPSWTVEERHTVGSLMEQWEALGGDSGTTSRECEEALYSTSE